MYLYMEKKEYTQDIHIINRIYIYIYYVYVYIWVALQRYKIYM